MSVSTEKANRGRGMKVALGAFGVVLLAAVPALGLTTLGTDFFPAGQASEESAGAAQVSNVPFTFDAPMVSLRHVHPPEARDGRAAWAERDDAAVVLADWRFTKTTTTFAVLAGDILRSLEQHPLFWAYVATQIPGLFGAVHDYLDSLSPIQRDALLLYAFLILSMKIGSNTPTPPVSGSH